MTPKQRLSDFYLRLLTEGSEFDCHLHIPTRSARAPLPTSVQLRSNSRGWLHRVFPC